MAGQHWCVVRTFDQLFTEGFQIIRSSSQRWPERTHSKQVLTCVNNPGETAQGLLVHRTMSHVLFENICWKQSCMFSRLLSLNLLIYRCTEYDVGMDRSLLTSRWFFEEKGTNEEAHAFLTKIRTLSFSEPLWKNLLRPVHSQKRCGIVHLIKIILLLLFLLSSTKSVTHELEDAFPCKLKIIQEFISRLFINECMYAVVNLVE